MLASSLQTQLGGSISLNHHHMQHNTGGNGGGDGANPYSNYTSPRDGRQLSHFSAPQHYSSWGSGNSGIGNNTTTSSGLPGAWSDHHHQHSQPYPASSPHDHTPTTSPTLEHSPSDNDAMYRGANVMQGHRIPSSTSYSTGVGAGMPSTASSYGSLNNLGSSNSALSSASAYQQDAPHYYGLGTGESGGQSYFGINNGTAPATSSSYVARAGDLDAGSATATGVPNAYSSHFPAQQPSSQLRGSQSSSSSAGGQHYPHHPHYASNYGFQQDTRAQYFNPFEVKHRRRTTRTQFKVLEGTFSENPKPTASMRKQLSEQLDMPLRAVQIWFQNRRAKAKAVAKKEASGQTKSAGSSSSSRRDDSKEDIQDEGKDQQREGSFRSRQTTNVTSDSQVSSEQDDRGLGLINADGQDSSFKMPNRPARYGSANFNQATPGSSVQPLHGFGTSSGASSSSTSSTFSGTPFSEQLPTSSSSFHSSYSYEHMQRPVSSTSSTSSYAGGDDRYTRRPLTASSDSSSSVYHNAPTSLSALTPTAATIGIGAASPSIASQHGQHHQQDFYGGVDASRRLSCPGDVSAMGSNIEHTSPIQQQHPADLARQQHQQPHSDDYATHQAGSHSYWR